MEGLKKLTGKQGTTIDRLEKQLRLTKEPSVRIEDAQKLARQLIKEYSSKADYVAVQKQLKELNEKKTELENLEIVNTVRSMVMDKAQIMAFLSSMKNGKAAKQPSTTHQEVQKHE